MTTLTNYFQVCDTVPVRFPGIGPTGTPWGRRSARDTVVVTESD